MSLNEESNISYSKQLEINPSLYDMENWESLKMLTRIEVSNKEFIQRKNIVNNVLQGSTLTATAKKYNVSISKVHYLMDRTLGSKSVNDAPALAKGLLPNVFINKRLRTKKLSKHDDEIGARGSFKYILFTVKGLFDYLDELLINHIKRVAHSEILTPKSFQKCFLKFLELRNWSEFKYPFNTDSKAYESCRKYFHNRINELKMPKPKLNRIINSPLVPVKAYQEVQLDAQMLDVKASLSFRFRGREIQTSVSRITLYLARDKATGCILSYHLSYTKHPNRYDVIKLLSNIHTKWEPMDLTTPGLEYTPGACLPSYLGEIYQSVGLGKVMLDNAMAHLANIVREYLTEDLNVTMNLGLPATPKARNLIENAFDVLNYHVHRIQSTTGSHVRDPKKETKKNSKKPPVMSMQALEEIISVLITNENVTPKELLGSKTPLDAIKEDVQSYPLWIHYDQSYQNKNPFVSSKIVPVKTIEHENRTPHINFMKMRYKGAGLNNSKLIGKKIIVSIDSRDIRSLKASTIDGEYLGIIKCPMSWQLYPLSLTTKQHVQKLVKNKIIDSKDPLAGYFAYLFNNVHLPKISLELYKLVDHAKLVNKELIDAFSDDLESDTSCEIGQDLESNYFTTVEIPDWSIDLINDDYEAGDNDD